MWPSQFFAQLLSPNDSAVPVRIGEALASQLSDYAVVPTNALSLQVYAARGHCTLSLRDRPFADVKYTWGGLDNDRLERRTYSAVYDVLWRGESLIVVEASWQLGYNSISRAWVAARERPTAEAFILDVERITNSPDEAILVFSGGCWQESHELYQATQSASFDNLILDESLQRTLRKDFQNFLASRAEYEALGVPWRRGVLLLGPPGNGKTQCLRALTAELGLPTLYVQSLKTRYETEEAMLKKVFERARQLRPCILIFEDLDAMITSANRSVFLNQMDGFDKNIGLIVIATTNHPESLDPAILDRPSRFDRKVHFPLPASRERERYMQLWRKKLGARATWSAEVETKLVQGTEGFSFAYLQELLMSALLRLADEKDSNLDSLLTETMVMLVEQMRTSRAMLQPTASSTADDVDDE
jgi:AAA+ superfamily predicted ATPase